MPSSKSSKRSSGKKSSPRKRSSKKSSPRKRSSPSKGKNNALNSIPDFKLVLNNKVLKQMARSNLRNSFSLSCITGLKPEDISNFAALALMITIKGSVAIDKKKLIQGFNLLDKKDSQGVLNLIKLNQIGGDNSPQRSSETDKLEKTLQDLKKKQARLSRRGEIVKVEQEIKVSERKLEKAAGLDVIRSRNIVILIGFGVLITIMTFYLSAFWNIESADEYKNKVCSLLSKQLSPACLNAKKNLLSMESELDDVFTLKTIGSVAAVGIGTIKGLQLWFQSTAKDVRILQNLQEEENDSKRGSQE